MSRTDSERRAAAERVMRDAEQVNPRKPDESAFAWRMRLLVWTMTTPEGKAAFAAAMDAATHMEDER